jgi:hypothetical protein
VGSGDEESLVSRVWGRAPLPLTRLAGGVAYRL